MSKAKNFNDYNLMKHITGKLWCALKIYINGLLQLQNIQAW